MDRHINSLIGGTSLFCMVLLSGCVSIDSPFKGWFDKKVSTKIVEIPPRPEKDPEHEEKEKQALGAGIRHIEKAHALSTDKQVKQNITNGLKLLEALQRSLGGPVEESEATIEEMRSIIKNLEYYNRDYRHRLDTFWQELKIRRDSSLKLESELLGLRETHKGALETLSTYFWWAVIASVLVSVLVPGGSILAKRFWRKVGGLATFAGKSAIGACQNMSKQLVKYSETLNDQEKLKFKKVLKEMEPENIKYWDDILQKKDPIKERLLADPRIKNKYIQEIFEEANNLS